jgi:hypothetical protein
MSDDEKPSPIEDVRKGLGLLFRAARTTLEKLPKRDFEDAVTTGVKEVGRAVENVTRTIERDLFGVRRDDSAPPHPTKEQEAGAPPEEPKDGPTGTGG